MYYYILIQILTIINEFYRLAILIIILISIFLQTHIYTKEVKERKIYIYLHKFLIQSTKCHLTKDKYTKVS